MAYAADPLPPPIRSEARPLSLFARRVRTDRVRAMVKSREEVIAQFNEEVNMTADELEQWLEDPKSSKAGTGVGVESGHKIVEILRKNPEKDPEKYDDEDIEHMRRVVSYAKRHLAQEEHLKDTKTREELENTKSTISLKNWGHDPIKTLEDEDKREEDGAAEPNPALQNGEKAEATQEDGTTGGAEDKSIHPKASNKRKLDKDEPETDAGAEKEPGKDEVDHVGDSETREDGDVDGTDGDDAEDRPRKKSKVNQDI